jgi:uncharacterized phosphosugar-binding protein
MASLGGTYIDVCITILERLRREQSDRIRRAGEIISAAIVEGRSFFAFGCTHSNLPVQDVYYRAGGLMLVNPVFPPGLSLDVRPPTLTSSLERLEGYGKLIFQQIPAHPGDVMVLLSTSGRNPVPVEVALEAKAHQMALIAVTSLAYATSVSSRHPSGRKVHEIADLVIDNYSPPGDAVLSVEGLPQKTGSTSGVVGSVIMHAIVSEVVERLVDQGITPPIYVSGNLDGGMAHNERQLQQYRDHIFYL